MQGKGDIENFLKKRLDNLENRFQDDWSVFEQKLEKAIHLQRLRRMAWMGAFSLLLLGIFVSVNMYQIWGGDPYQPRTEEVYLDDTLEGAETLAEPEPESIMETAENTKEVFTGSNEPGSTQVSTTTGKTPEKSKGQKTTPVAESNDKVDRAVATAPISGTATKPLSADKPAGSNKSAPDDISVNGNESPVGSQSVASLNVEDNDGPDKSGEELSTNQRVQQIETSRNGLVLIDNLQMPKGGLIQNPEQPKLRYTTGDGYNESAFKGIDMALRSPIEAVNISTDHGPYVSPLQPANPWSYSLNVYPNFTFRKFRVDQDKLNLLHRDFVDAVQAAESGGFSLNVGFEVSKRIGEITYVNTGVEYISYKTDVVYNFTSFREAHINEAGEIIGYTLKDETEVISFSDNNAYHYLNFPISFSYQPWASDHVRLNVELGGSFLYFVTAKGQTLNYKTLEIIDLSEREYKNYIGSLCFKVGANYYVSPRINVGFEPTIMYFTNTIYTNDYPFYVIPYSVGLNLNLQVKLN
ncbi:MAG: hypothetical protein ACPF9D_00430 [Owenweeksia sp.]